MSFWSIVCRPDNDVFEETGGEHGMPIILASSHTAVISGATGLASVAPSATGIEGPVEVEITATAGASAVENFEVESAWMPPGSYTARRKLRVSNDIDHEPDPARRYDRR